MCAAKRKMLEGVEGMGETLCDVKLFSHHPQPVETTTKPLIEIEKAEEIKEKTSTQLQASFLHHGIHIHRNIAHKVVEWNWLEKWTVKCFPPSFLSYFRCWMEQLFPAPLRTRLRSASCLLKLERAPSFPTCHLHPLHLLFYIINNYNKAIVLFNNFCAVRQTLCPPAIRLVGRVERS